MPPFASIAIGQPVPADGEFEIVDEGKRYAVVVHPRIPGHWMAFIPPRNWRDAGMKKFKTRNGAVRFVMKSLTPALSSHDRAPQGE